MIPREHLSSVIARHEAITAALAAAPSPVSRQKL
jgi:hypothetical protein